MSNSLNADSIGDYYRCYLGGYQEFRQGHTYSIILGLISYTPASFIPPSEPFESLGPASHSRAHPTTGFPSSFGLGPPGDGLGFRD